MLLTREMQLDDYGRVLVVINLFTFLNYFAGLRVNDLMYRFFGIFKDEDDRWAVQGLLLLCLLISIGTGLLIVSATLLLAPLMAERLCHNRGLASLFIIYGSTSLVSVFADVFGPILRIYDRFKSLAVPQVIASLFTFVLLIIYFAGVQQYSLPAILTIFAIGVLIQSIWPLARSLVLVKGYLSNMDLRRAAGALGAHRRQIMGCLFNSNLYGYVRVALSPGDIFVLGMFSTPAQVGLYGLAKQLIAPSALLITHVQTTLTPEIVTLVARRKLAQLQRLLRGYLIAAVTIGGLLTIAGFVAGKFFVLRVARPEYVEALPIFYILLISAWGLLILTAFRPIALGFDLLRWENLAYLVTTALLLFLIVNGWVNALTLAIVQLLTIVIFRTMFTFPVLMRLRTASRR